jgi:hypothetical protein
MRPGELEPLGGMEDILQEANFKEEAEPSR